MDEVISESSAYKMLVMLRAVINEGTGGRVRRLYGITADMGGKTGTTNNNSDGWFMGFTPSLVSGVWVGGEDRDIHFDTMVNGQGLPWRCRYGDSICRKYIRIKVWDIHRKNVSIYPKTLILVRIR